MHYLPILLLLFAGSVLDAQTTAPQNPTVPASSAAPKVVIGVAPLRVWHHEKHEMTLQIPGLESTTLPGAVIEGDRLTWNYSEEAKKRRRLGYDYEMSQETRDYILLNFRQRYAGNLFTADFKAKDENYAPYVGKLKVYMGMPLFPYASVGFREYVNTGDDKEPAITKDAVYGLYHDPRADPEEKGAPQRIDFVRGTNSTTYYSGSLRENITLHKINTALPMLYDSPRLTTIRAAGGYTADIQDLQISGIPIQLFRTLECGKPNTFGYVNRQAEWSGIAVIVPPEFNNTEPFLIDGEGRWTDRILKADVAIQCSGRYFGTKAKVWFEYKEGNEVKVLPLTIKENWANDTDGYSTIKFAMPSADIINKAGTEPVYIIIDSGIGFAIKRITAP